MPTLFLNHPPPSLPPSPPLLHNRFRNHSLDLVRVSGRDRKILYLRYKRKRETEIDRRARKQKRTETPSWFTDKWSKCHVSKSIDAQFRFIHNCSRAISMHRQIRILYSHTQSTYDNMSRRGFNWLENSILLFVGCRFCLLICEQCIKLFAYTIVWFCWLCFITVWMLHSHKIQWKSNCLRKRLANDELSFVLAQFIMTLYFLWIFSFSDGYFWVFSIYTIRIFSVQLLWHPLKWT